MTNLRDEFPNMSDDVLRLNESQSSLSPRTENAPHQSERWQKYGAVPTEYNGFTYASKAEAKKAEELDLLVKTGEIDFWLRQVPFPLGAGIVYRADFITFTKRVGEELRDFGKLESLWFVTVIEVKGFAKRADWRMKEKLFRKQYPNLTLEITK